MIVPCLGRFEDLFHSQRHARGSRRLENTFALLHSGDNGTSWQPAYGLDMSLTGLKAFSRTAIPDGEVPIRISLGSAVVDLRARPVWYVLGKYQAKPAHEYGMQLFCATATARERIQRWVTGKPLEA